MSENAVETKRRGILRAPLLAVAAAVVTAGVLALGATGYVLANGPHRPFGPGHRGQLLANPELAKKRAAFGAEWLLRSVGGTAQQKERAQAITAGLVDEILPLAREHQQYHKQFIEALAAPTVDREALEQIRQSELRLAEAASKALVNALADFSESLRPEQRTELRELGRKAHELHGGPAE